MNIASYDEQSLADYLARQLNRPVHIEHLEQLGGGATGAEALKAFGYGSPVSITYLADNKRDRVVLRRVVRTGFGRERGSDRVAEVWRDYHTFNLLPKHVAVRDILVLKEDKSFHSISDAREVMLLTDYASGQIYANDLLSITHGNANHDQNKQRAEALALYLAQIHAVKHSDALLWRRRLRDLLGHGEGIMGLTDSYPIDDPIATSERLQAIEIAANRWRWQLKPLTHRLSQVHGDFHPYNILFSPDNDFTLLDRSRGQWGEPADDVSCLMINYLFFSLQRGKKLTGLFLELYNLFWNVYLEQSKDQEILDVIAPWISWRALVLASPQWYPTREADTRRRLLNLASNVLLETRFDWTNINGYLEAN